MTRPAVLGGARRFPDPLPFVRPSLPPLEEVVRRLAPSYATGQITDGQLVRQLEERVASRIQTEHVVAVSSCTIGLMLVWRALQPDGPVVVPSFTFAASAHALDWNGIELVFAECDPGTFQVDTSSVARQLEGVAGVMATHVFGAPGPADELATMCEAAGVPLVFDAAHALGALHGEVPVGRFGTAEVFSLTPTKPLVAGEGGLVALKDADLARAIRVGRNYGNPGDYDSLFPGLNGRMSEFHAAMALASLERFDDDLAARRVRAARYCTGISEVKGVHPQNVITGDISTWKDFTISIDEDVFGLNGAEVAAALRAEGVDNRRYFSPPVHLQTAYLDRYPASLPVTERVSDSVVSLPVWPDLDLESVDAVVEILADLSGHADEIRARVA